MECLLSIIIPIYNVEKYLKRCMDSILIQDLTNCEIILVDDGSTDSSPTICDEYASQYQNVISIHKENGGASDARNYGTKRAKGKYIWYIDSDDYLEPGCMKDFVDIINNHMPDVIVIQSKVVEEDGSVRDECIYTINSGLYSSEQLLKELKKNPKSVIFCPQCYMVSRKFIEDNNLHFYKGIIHEDELWIPQLLIKANLIYYSGLNVYYHCMRSSSVMHSTKLEKSGTSAYTVSTQLLSIFEKSERTDLQFLRDHNANIFLQAVWKVPNFLEKKENIMRTMPLKNSLYIKTKIKSLLYFISPKLYLKIHQIARKK